MTRSKYLYIAAVFFSFFFTGCPHFPTGAEKYTLGTPEQLIQKMNEAGYGTTFSLLNYEYNNDNEYEEKKLTVYMTSPDYQGMTFTALEIVTTTLPTRIDDEEDIESNARLSYISYDKYYFTDFYTVIYKQDFTNYLTELFSPVIEENPYKLAYKIDLFNNQIGKIYTSFEKYAKNVDYCDASLLVNRSFDESFERKFNAFCYTMNESEKLFYSPVFYFSQKYMCSNVSETQLLEGNFYAEEDTEITKKRLNFCW